VCRNCYSSPPARSNEKEVSASSAEFKPLSVPDYLLGAVALVSLLVVGFVTVLWLGFGLAAAGNNGMSRFDSIALYVWLASIVATIYFFGRLFHRRRYIIAIAVSWCPIVLFVVLIYVHEWFIR
jgi:hypothetical protein